MASGACQTAVPPTVFGGTYLGVKANPSDDAQREVDSKRNVVDRKYWLDAACRQPGMIV